MYYQRWAVLADYCLGTLLDIRIVKRGHRWDYAAINKIATQLEPGVAIGFGSSEQRAKDNAVLNTLKREELKDDARVPASEMDKIYMCNCGWCGQELLGFKNPPHVIRKYRTNWEVAAARLRGRPVCVDCLGDAIKEAG